MAAEAKPRLTWKPIAPGILIAESERFNYRIVDQCDGTYDVSLWNYLWKAQERYLDCGVTLKEAKAAAEKHENKKED